MIVARSGKSSSSTKWSGCRTRESATKATPGVDAPRVSCTLARSNSTPCAFQGVMAQASVSGYWVRVTPGRCSAWRVRGSSGTQVARLPVGALASPATAALAAAALAAAAAAALAPSSTTTTSS